MLFGVGSGGVSCGSISERFALLMLERFPPLALDHSMLVPWFVSKEQKEQFE
jgi:hypothetical protein